MIVPSSETVVNSNDLQEEKLLWLIDWLMEKTINHNRIQWIWISHRNYLFFLKFFFSLFHPFLRNEDLNENILIRCDVNDENDFDSLDSINIDPEHRASDWFRFDSSRMFHSANVSLFSQQDFHNSFDFFSFTFPSILALI